MKNLGLRPLSKPVKRFSLSMFLSISSCSTCDDDAFYLSSYPSSYPYRRRRLYCSSLSSSRPMGCLSSSLFLSVHGEDFTVAASALGVDGSGPLGPYQRWRNVEARFPGVVLVAFYELLCSLYPPCCMCVCV